MMKNVKNVLILFIIAIFIIVNIIPLIPAFADDTSDEIIKIECEKPSASNFTLKTSPSSDKPPLEGLSGGYMLVYNATTLPSSGEFELIYKVYSVDGGVYSLQASTQDKDSKYTSKYYIQVNGGELINARENAAFISEQTEVTGYGKVNKYDFGTFTLMRGENIIKIVINEKRESDNSRYVFYLDCIELTKISSINNIKLKAGEPLGIFEHGQPVSYTLSGSSKATEDSSYSYNIIDYWGSNVRTGDLTFKAGTKELHFTIDNLGTGWYQLKINDSRSTLFSTYFAVVPPLSERIETDTPFATDFASAWYVDKEKEKDYCKAARLAGITWVRERCIWEQLEPSRDVNSFKGLDFRVDTISGEGLKVLEMFSSAPAWACPGGGVFPDDLFDVYNFMKEAADYFKGRVHAWEIWNEQDSPKYEESADLYAAMFKAGAIGIADSDENAIKMHGGFAYNSAQSDYTDLLLQNGLMMYSDVYNYHNHVSYNGKNYHKIGSVNLAENTFAALAYDTENRPLWVTEAGIKLPVSGAEAIPSLNALTAAARYIVTSAVESLAAGNEKHFWFLFPHYYSNGSEMCAFSYLDTPYPCYAAESVMTKVLGQGKYGGMLKNMPSGAQGHIFRTGTGDAAVIWSEDTTSIQLKSDKNLKVIDIMGGERIENCKDGYVSIQISPDPVYVDFEGECDINNYLKKEYKESSLEAHSFTKAEHIVLVQNFPESTKIDVRKDGYKISEDAPAVVTVDVYNFNDTPMSGTVKGLSEGGFTIEPLSAEVQVGAMSKATVSFTISGNEKVIPNTESFLRFAGQFDGEETSPSVSKICLLSNVVIEPDGLFPNANNPEEWELKSITAGATAAATVDSNGALTFKCNFSGGTRWFYPYYKVKDPSVLADKDGIVFWAYFDKDDPDTNINVSVVLNDGRTYNKHTSRVVSSISMKSGWRQIRIPWSEFMLTDSPIDKYNDARPFDQSLIEKISVGIVTKHDDLSPYSIKDLGYYTLPENMKPQDYNIIINGISDNAIVGAGSLNITATLPEGIIAEKTRVLLLDQECQYSLNGSELSIDLSNIEPGSYKLSIVTYTPAGYAVRRQLNFTKTE